MSRDGEDTSNLEYAIDIARWKVKSAFWTMTELIESTMDVLQHDESIDPQLAKRAARHIVIPLWNEQVAIEDSWPEEEKTIAEKLAVAFDSLDSKHQIPARMNFTCCRRCGVSEIGMDRDEDEPAIGYAFFTEQTTEGFVKHPGSGIMIYYGTFGRSRVKCEEVASRIVRVLRRAGLSVEWDGDTSNAMEVKCDEWRKRLIVEAGDSDFESDDEEEEGEEEGKEEVKEE
ncbi:hypothetical protein ACJ72_04418 [Emergomyces africanus]|uniref:DUF6891 domain-containing protein n=1 Tax=Emergomyces africanus TaxID=1955775 RepID=A0A1B7NWT2_9EURO|nr:hypothetical protein ACJ72_04418 [Emergomyces africanus]